MGLLARCGGFCKTLDEPVGSGTDVGAKHKASVNNFAGLVTAYGQLGAPPGAFSVADNVDFPNSFMVEKRRGTLAFGSTGQGVPASLVSADPTGFIIANLAVDASLAVATKLDRWGYSTAIPTPGALTALNDVTTRMKGAIGRKNTYLTTQNGVVRLESDGVAWWAGAPSSGPLVEQIYTSAGGTWFANGATTSYRLVLVQYDADGVPMRGPPSAAGALTNTTGVAKAVTFGPLYLGPPPYAVNAVTSGVSAIYADPTNLRRIDLEVYRAVQSTTGTPNDEMQLAYRKTLSASEKNGSAIAGFVDQCPDEALGAYLYTNAISGGDTVQNGVSLGLAARNDPPPTATDVATFANRMWFSGLTLHHSLTFSLIAPGTTGAEFKTGDVVTVAGVALTAGSHFGVYTSGSISDNIRKTAMSLAGAVGLYVLPTTGVTAEYVGSPLSPGTVGQIRLYATQTARAAFFTIAVTSGGSGTAFIPDLSAAVRTTREDWTNGLAYSKDSQPDAVPPVNYIRVGRGDIPIMRMIALRDALFVFAADGIWIITGNDPSNFSLTRFDTTFTLLARDTVVVLDDAIYAWGNEGIARITTSGVTLIDAAIRDVVNQQRIAGVSTAWAVTDRNRKRVIFFLPNHVNTANALGSSANRALVYHASGSMGATAYSAAVNGRWSRYDYGVANAKTCACQARIGVATPFFLGNADNGGGTPNAGDETNGPGYSAGGGLYASGVAESASNAATDWRDRSNAATDVAITSTLRWTNATPDAQMVAQWMEVAALFAPSDTVAVMGAPSALTFGFKTEMQSTEQTVTWTRPSAPYINSQARVMVPRDAARGSRMFFALTHAVVSEYFALDGFGLWYEFSGHEVTR
jgi:hypothetical protein